MRTQLLVLGVALTVACGRGDGGPVAPQQPLPNTVKSASSVVQAELLSNASPTHGLTLTCFAGPCGGAAGTVNFSAPARSVDGAAPRPASASRTRASTRSMALRRTPSTCFSARSIST